MSCFNKSIIDIELERRADDMLEPKPQIYLEGHSYTVTGPQGPGGHFGETGKCLEVIGSKTCIGLTLGFTDGSQMDFSADEVTEAII